MAKPQLERDRCQFPMLWVDTIDAWMHWFPVTKIQFELFLADQRDPQVTGQAYEEMCQLNSRCAPQEVSSKNYWQAFVTGVKPQETEAFARWCGADFRLPTPSEWLTAYESLTQQDMQSIEWEALFDGVPPRRVRLFTAIDQIAKGAKGTMADQTLMRQGVAEWIRDDEEPPNWGGWGEPPPDFANQLSTLGLADPIEPLDPTGERIPYFGFRLLKSADKSHQP